MVPVLHGHMDWYHEVYRLVFLAPYIVAQQSLISEVAKQIDSLGYNRLI